MYSILGEFQIYIEIQLVTEFITKVRNKTGVPKQKTKKRSCKTERNIQSSLMPNIASDNTDNVILKYDYIYMSLWPAGNKNFEFSPGPKRKTLFFFWSRRKTKVFIDAGYLFN